jgi:hypothetical protein
MPTKQEWMNSTLLGSAGAGAAKTTYDLSMLRSAAVQAEKLTGVPEWDRFLEKVQARRNEFWAQYESWREQLEIAKNEDAVKAAQINCAIYKNCAFALDEIMALPGDLIKEHKNHA